MLHGISIASGTEFVLLIWHCVLCVKLCFMLIGPGVRPKKYFRGKNKVTQWMCIQTILNKFLFVYFLGGCCFKPKTSKDGLILFETETVLSLEIRKPKNKPNPASVSKVIILILFFNLLEEKYILYRNLNYFFSFSVLRNF